MTIVRRMARFRCCGMWSSRFRLWLLMNHVLLRPAFFWLNDHAFREWYCPVPPPSDARGRALNDTGLQVVVASHGSSGSTTLHMVLEEFGFRTYGPEEFAFYMPALRHAAASELDWTHDDAGLKACGVRAIAADMITMPLVKALMPLSPNAKLIVLRRPWATFVAAKRRTLSRGPLSNLAMGILTQLGLCNWLPWGLAWHSQPGDRGSSFVRSTGGITMELLNHCSFLPRGYQSVKANPSRSSRLAVELRHLMEDEQAYNDSFDDFRRLAPSHQVWEAETDQITFENLTDLLGLPSPARKGLLPRMKTSGWGKLLIRMQAHPIRHALALAFLVMTVWVNWLLFCVFWNGALRYRRCRCTVGKVD